MNGDGFKSIGWANLAATLNEQQQEEVIHKASEKLVGLPMLVMRDREQMLSHARQAIGAALSELGYVASEALAEDMARRLAAHFGGMGFLDALLPPNRDDLSEIALNPDGTIWLLPKGEDRFVPYEYRPTLEETWRTIEALLAPTGRALTEATPSVDAKLPRFPNMGGARVKVIHPILAPGEGYPVFNIRLFEPRPVTPKMILEWEAVPPFVLDRLLEAVANRLRVLVIGGTATGKTTVLCALANGGIPDWARVVKIEDPEEIWLEKPNVVTLEARPTSPGANVPPYTVTDGVNDAMRMAPQWLIVGEVRTGDAALALFRAQMSDHPGLTTFHADGPDAAVHRMAVIMVADTQINRFEAARALFAEAIDLVVQVGWRESRRRVLAVHEVAGVTKDNKVKFTKLWEYGEEEMNPITRRRG